MAIPFTTKLRSKLFTYLFTNPDGHWYVRELADIINEDAGNLSRELRSLETEGLLTHHLKGRTKLYSVNKAHPLFTEFKSIIFKTAGIEGAIRNVIADYPGIEFAAIYGSYARGGEKGSSDIDLMVVGSFPRDGFTRRIRRLESELGRDINFTHFSKDEFAKERSKGGSFVNIVMKGKVIKLKGSLDAR